MFLGVQKLNGSGKKKKDRGKNFTRMKARM
jgi:hypothetical protein